MSVVEVAVTAINASHSCFGTVAAKRKCTTMLRQLLKGPSTSTSSYTRPAGSPNENHLASGRRGFGANFGCTTSSLLHSLHRQV